MVNRNNDIKAFLHDIGDCENLFNEVGIGECLILKKCIGILFPNLSQMCEVRIDIGFHRSYDDLDREEEGIHEGGISRNDTLLLCLALEVKVECFYLQYPSETSVFEEDRIVMDFSNRDVLLDRSTLFIAIAFAEAAALIGLFLSYTFNIPSGSAIVLMSLLGFLFALANRQAKK